VDRSPQAQRLAVRERILAGDLGHAAQKLDAGLDRSPETLQVELALADAFAQAGQFEAARRRLEQLTVWPLDRLQRAEVHMTRSAVEHLAGNEHQSRWELDQAHRLRGP
jgi:thioredoxin-like negative regulator of GroEL